MDEVETKQYCVAVKVWVWAENAEHAEDIVEGEMGFLIGVDNPVAGYEIGEAKEDQEV